MVENFSIPCCGDELIFKPLYTVELKGKQKDKFVKPSIAFDKKENKIFISIGSDVKMTTFEFNIKAKEPPIIKKYKFGSKISCLSSCVSKSIFYTAVCLQNGESYLLDNESSTFIAPILVRCISLFENPSYDNKLFMCTGSTDGLIDLFAPLYPEEQTFEQFCTSGINTIQISDNRKIIAVGFLDGCTVIYNTQNLDLIWKHNGKTGSIINIAWCFNSTNVLISSQDDIFISYNLNTKSFATFEGHTSYVNSVDSEKSRNREKCTIISSSSDCTLGIWELASSSSESNTSLVRKVGPFSQQIISIKFINNVLVTVDNEKSIIYVGRKS